MCFCVLLMPNSFDNKVNKNSFDLKRLKMEQKRTDALNWIYAGKFDLRGPTREVIRISIVSKSLQGKKT